MSDEPIRHAIGLVFLSALILIAYQIVFWLWRQWDTAEANLIPQHVSFKPDHDTYFLFPESALLSLIVSIALPEWKALEAGVLLLLLAIMGGPAGWLSNRLKLVPDAPRLD
jgi:hypothetical protein